MAPLTMEGGPTDGRELAGRCLPHVFSGRKLQAASRTLHQSPMYDAARLVELQRRTFDYFLHERHPATGLVKDNTRPDAPTSIAAVGMALACYPVAVERGFVDRGTAAQHVRTVLRFLSDSDQTGRPRSTGYRGFYFHFLHTATGRRHRKCELSTIDSTILIAGALLAAQYFDADDTAEAEVRETADALYRRMDWHWALNDGLAVSHGWTPERGFLRARWLGYNEALMLYFLGLGSPTYPLPADSYAEWTHTYRWKSVYGHPHLYAGPLFIHQLSHAWIDFRGIQDAYMRQRGLDYFENSRRATIVQREYAIRNPGEFAGYGPDIWGITASDGPGPATLDVGGRRRRFHGYHARGVPWGADDGTLSPWAVAASLPFAPELVLSALSHLDEAYPATSNTYGIRASFNPTFPNGPGGWVSRAHFGLDQGPVILMIENHLTELPWRLMRGSTFLVEGLRRAGFEGGWIDDATPKQR